MFKKMNTSRQTIGEAEKQREQETLPETKEVKFEANASRGLCEWLLSKKCSIAVTTYQVGKLIFFGVDDAGKLWVHNRNVGRCLGLYHDQDGFWVTSDNQLFRFVELIGENAPNNGPDCIYVPRKSYFTGDLDIHDLAPGTDGRPIFVNSLFNCLARPSDEFSFEPVWKPDFISKLVAEDRCHLNGLATDAGRPRFVTAVSTSDIFDGWRDHRGDGGVVIDVASNEIISSGLSMPHSPRWHNDELWLHNSGSGEFGKIDLDSGQFIPVAFCPGYLRGMDFIDNTAVIGLSLPRNKTFSGLTLEDRLKAEKINARCGLYFIDLGSGNVVHSLVFEGVVSELYDIAVIKGKTQPMAFGPNSREISRTLSLHEGAANSI